MKLTHVTPDNKNFEYTENFWTGRKELTIDGNPAEKRNKKEFVINSEIYTAKGNFLFGAKLVSGEKEIILCKNTWWQWILIILPFAYLAIGLFGGAIGGGLSALAAMIAATLNAVIIRSEMNIVFKIMLGLVITAALFVAWVMVYMQIVGALFGVMFF